MRLRTGAVIFLTMLTGVSKAETIPTIKINDFIIKKTYESTAFRPPVKSNSAKSACSMISFAHWEDKLNGCYYWGGSPGPQYLIFIGFDVWAYYASGNVRTGYYGRESGEPVFEIGQTESCPAGYTMKSFALGKSCYKPDDGCERDPQRIAEHKLLSAIAKGESTDGEIYDEMQGIAAATLRRVKAARKDTLNALIKKYPRYSYVVCSNNELYNNLLCDKDEGRHAKAYDAAKSALEGKEDRSNGGCFWDGKDLKAYGKNHTTYKAGFKFSDPSHNIFGIQEPPPLRKKGEKEGYYDYTYISTAAHGNTIFWKISDEFLKANGARQCV